MDQYKTFGLSLLGIFKQYMWSKRQDPKVSKTP